MITVDNLKCYLNTNLQGIINNDFNEIHYMIGLSSTMVYTDRTIVPINTFIPIMRNIDNIINNNLYINDNKPIIPLFEIVKLYTNNIKEFLYLSKINMDDSCEEYGKTIFACGWKNEKNEEYKFFYSKEKQSFFSSKMNELPKIIPNQQKYFNILYNWHFWVGSDEYFTNNEIININKI